MPDLTIAPYYDTTSAERQKGYQRFLGVPERYIQGRDLTVLQHMVQQQLRDIADTLYKNGAVIEGCQLLLDETTVTITSGKVYYNGFVVSVEETSLEITGEGEEIIGIKITETIINEGDDSTLRGPVPGSEAYGQPGMHRLKIEASIVYGNEVQLPLYKFIGGSPLTVLIDPAMTELYNILARRTYDESENYLVHGLEVFAFPSGDGNNIELTIEAGKCYVEGFEIDKPYPTKIVQGKCTSTNIAIDSYHTIATGVTTYTFGKQPLASVNYIKGHVMVTGANFIRTANPYDDLGLDNLVTIHSIYLTNPESPYVLGEDYTKSGDQITWLLGGPNTPPAVGATYYVTYTDKQTLEAEVDYKLVKDSNDLDAFELQNTGRVQDLVGASQLEVYYNYYLGRKDIVYIDKEGQIIIIEGTPNDTDHVAAPLVPDRVLARSEVYLPPNSNNAIVTNYFVRRLSMPDLHKVVRRLENLEYNMALKDMDNPSLYRVSAHQVANMFTEGFVGFSKANTSHPNWNLGIDTTTNIGSCPYNNIAYQDFDIDVATATLKGVGYLLPYTHESYISQMLASGSHNINPYSVYGRVAIISVEPPFRYYSENVVVQEGIEDTEIERNHLIIKTVNVTRPRQSTETTSSVSKITSSWFEDRLLRSEAMEYIPETILVVTGTNFFPNQNNLQIYFDGTSLNATPLDGTPAGSIAGTVKSKADGTLKLQFTIPANTFRTGVRKIELKNTYQEANVAFTANGIKNLFEKINRRIITTDNYTTRTNYRQIVPVEPLAQTFYNAESSYITKINLYFKTKDTADIPIFVQIRNVVNGYPGETILGHKLVYPSSIYTSTNGSIATTIEFDTPVFVESGNEYCFVIGSDSNNYEIFIAEMGQTDIITEAPITRQPYFQGTMFSSANANAWTAHQMTDIKFNLYRAKFNLTPAYVLSSNETVNHTHFSAGVESTKPDGTSITWYYSNNNGTTWIPFNPLDFVCTAERSTTLKFKAVLSSTNTYLSPMLYPTIQAIFFDQAGSGTYISKQTTVVDTFNKLKCYLDVYIPLSSGQSITLSISTDEGSSWTNLTPDSSTAMSYGWVRRYYEEDLSPAKNKIMFKITISTTNRSGRVQPAIANLVGMMLSV